MRSISKLRNSYNRDREHDTLVDGYRIKLITASKKKYYISVCQKSSNSARGGVIPHIGLDSGASMDNAGEYISPEFQNWALKNIAPLFNKEPNASIQSFHRPLVLSPMPNKSIALLSPSR
jgi:hypothetical protein